MIPDQIKHLENVRDLFKHIPPGHRLLALKNLCINNGGRWDFSAEFETENPVLYEIQVFGVSAMAAEKEDLARNWLRAVSNIVDAEDKEAA